MGFALPLIGAIGGAATGALGNTRGARTSTMSGNRSSQNSGYTSRVLTEEQKPLASMLKQYGSDLMMNPAQGLEPFKTAATNTINQGFSAMPQTLAARYLGSGGTKSGKYGRAARLAETSRLGQLANVENQFGQMAVQRQDQGAALLQQLLGMNFGQYTTQSGNEDYDQTSIGPGSALGGGLGGALAGLLGGYNANGGMWSKKG